MAMKIEQPVTVSFLGARSVPVRLRGRRVQESEQAAAGGVHVGAHSGGRGVGVVSAERFQDSAMLGTGEASMVGVIERSFDPDADQRADTL
jgi:hypothetical protein